MRDIIRQVLKEETDDDRLLSYFKKKWDKEKDSGVRPVFDPSEPRKLGLQKYSNTIRLGFIDYYNKNYGDVYRAALNDLTSNTFTTDDIEKLGIKVGTYDFKFQIYDVLVDDIPANGNIGKIKAYVKIIEGTVTAADGETYDLTDYNNPDLEFWWEVETEVDDLVDLFIEKKILLYGIILDNLVTNVAMYKNTDSINENVDDKKIDIANKFFNSLKLIPYHFYMRDIIRKVLKEETDDDRLLSYFKKKWNKEKDGGRPTFNPDEIRRLGLMKHFNKIRLGFIDYYEKNIGNPYEDVLKELTDTTFTTEDITKLGIDVGSYDFKFDIEDILVYEGIKVNGSFGMIKPYVRIKEGTVISHDGETFDLTDVKNAEEQKYWDDVEYEVDDLISLFIEKKLLSYGFNLDDLNLVVYMYKNKGSLNESVDDKKINLANKFFNSLRLVPYHSKGYKMEFLGTKKGSYLFLSHRKSITIQNNIYDILLKILGKEKYVESFVWDKLKDVGFTLAPPEFMYFEKDNDIGSFNPDEDEEYGLLKKPKKLTEAKMLPKNKFAKAWLSKFNDLKKYKSENGRFIYLANNNGTILVSLDTQINETAVSWEIIWSMLERYFTEKETRRKIIGWLLDRYHLMDMGYVYSETQDIMGKIDSDDTLIETGQITESQQKNQLKDYFFKKWAKQKGQGQIPKLSFKEIKGLGLTKYMNEIIFYYSEFMNLDPNDTNRRTEILKNYLLNNTFNENDITEMKDSFDDGKIEVKFNKVEFSENKNQVKNYLDLDIEFEVLSGSFYNTEEHQTFNFSGDENPFDDFVAYFEFKEAIEQVVESFIFEVIESFGFNINDHFDYISVKW
jgi:hypothetical protein